jgi:hypothetical protein
MEFTETACGGFGQVGPSRKNSLRGSEPFGRSLLYDGRQQKMPPEKVWKNLNFF